MWGYWAVLGGRNSHFENRVYVRKTQQNLGSDINISIIWASYDVPVSRTVISGHHKSEKFYPRVSNSKGSRFQATGPEFSSLVIVESNDVQS